MKSEKRKAASRCMEQRVVRFSKLSAEAQEVLVGMVEFCLDNHYRMGMDEGFTKHDKKRAFRIQLEAFVNAESNDKTELSERSER